MPDRIETADGWTWQHPIGSLRCGDLTGRVDVSRPQLGLDQLRFGADELDGHVLGVAWGTESAGSLPSGQPPSAADAYVRGGDLVADYPPQADWPYASQIYWRAETAGPAEHVLASLTLWVSVQTDLLDSHPHVDVTSRLPADEVLYFAAVEDQPVHPDVLTGEQQRSSSLPVGAGCLLWRLPGGRLSYAEIVPASDFRQLDVQHDRPQPCRSRWQLFSEFLEKGVIRRACLQLVFLPRADDVARAAACCRSFRSRPLPLAT